MLEKITPEFEKIAQTLEKISQTFKKITRTFEKISPALEKISRLEQLPALKSHVADKWCPILPGIAEIDG
jgi:hypothetical protein